jgi:hypothetical protein
MQTITSTHGVHVHADLHELQRIRQQLTTSQLALWGDHSSRIAQMFGLSHNEIADVIFNDCGLVVWAIENPELGVAIAAGLTAVWLQLAILNSICNLVESKYQVGELTIDRKMALEHQLLEVAATAPFFAKLGLGGGDKSDAPKPKPNQPTPPAVLTPVTHGPVCAPVELGKLDCSGGESSGSSDRSSAASSDGSGTGGSAHPVELQDSKKLEGAAGNKGSHAQN